MNDRDSTSGLLLPALGALLLGLACHTVALGDVPEGIPLGPWVLAPSVETTYSYESNIFLEDDAESTSDRVGSIKGGLLATLPFRNSSLELGYAADRESFKVSDFPQTWAQAGKVDLQLNFKSGDRLSFREAYREDFARFEIDEFAEVRVFQPEPYSSNRWEVELLRNEAERQGYLVRVRRQDFIYKGDTDVGFFDYRGFDNVFEYRQPMPEQRRWVLRYNSRRFNHYDPRCSLPDSDTCLGGVGVSFRKQISDDFELGLMGVLGDQQPYVVRLGYSKFRYEGTNSSEYNGIVGYAAWRILVGGRTDLQLTVTRRAYPSNSDTYYVNNAVRAKLEREWLRFAAGTELEYYYNDYADPVQGCVSGVQDGLGVRKDSTYRVGADWGWRLHDRVKFEVSAFYRNRSSSCENNDYSGSGIESGFALGW